MPVDLIEREAAIAIAYNTNYLGEALTLLRQLPAVTPVLDLTDAELELWRKLYERNDPGVKFEVVPENGTGD